MICARLRGIRVVINMYLKCFFSLTVFFAVSCNHIDSKCSEINWYELGRQDSTARLKQEESFAKRQKVCPVSSDSIYAKAYENGFLFGLTAYCDFKTGYIYSLSQMGKEVSACPEDLKIKFLKGYEVGFYMKEIQSLQSEIQQKIKTIDEKFRSHEERLSMINEL